MKKSLSIGIILLIVVSLFGCMDSYKDTTPESTYNTYEETNITVTSETLVEKETDITELPIETKSETVIPEVYTDYLDMLSECCESKDLEMINRLPSHSDKEYGEYTGIKEVIMSSDTPLTDVGYAYIDLDGDSVYELIIMDISGKVISLEPRILEIYTCYNDEIHNVISSWARNRWTLLSDFSLYNEGSSGASYNAYGYFNPLDKETHTVEPNVIYYSCEDMTDGNVVKFYRTEKESELFFPGDYSEEVTESEFVENRNEDDYQSYTFPKIYTLLNWNYFRASDVVDFEEPIENYYAFGDVEDPIVTVLTAKNNHIPDGYYSISEWSFSPETSSGNFVLLTFWFSDAVCYEDHILCDGEDQLTFEDEIAVCSNFAISPDVIIGEGRYPTKWTYHSYDSLEDFYSYWQENARVYEDYETSETKRCKPQIKVKIENDTIVEMAVNPSEHQGWEELN